MLLAKCWILNFNISKRYLYRAGIFIVVCLLHKRFSTERAIKTKVRGIVTNRKDLWKFPTTLCVQKVAKRLSTWQCICGLQCKFSGRPIVPKKKFKRSENI